ncbi:MAG TPA: nitroreductase/quinone reductase family protein [Acidimicrobiia bacterium]|nr:nitroreductase/quinone reductase family protein [Acidimicrobiia bacterium]
MTNKRQDQNEPMGRLPGWLPFANLIVKWLQRRGLKTGTIHILTVPGRTSGQMRTTPISLLTLDGVDYTVGGLEDSDWVRNVRAAGWGYLAYGKEQRKVRITELAPDQRESVLRAFPIEIPHGTQFFERVHGIQPDPDGFASLADRCPVFHIHTINENSAPQT